MSVEELKFSLFTLSSQVKEKVKVEVGVEAVGGWGAVEGLDGGVLSLVEGEEREVVCEGREAYPAPSFLWDSHKPDISEGRRRGKSEEGRDGSEVKEVAERSVELELFNGDEEEEAIPLNTTSKVRQKSGWQEFERVIKEEFWVVSMSDDLAPATSLSRVFEHSADKIPLMIEIRRKSREFRSVSGFRQN